MWFGLLFVQVATIFRRFRARIISLIASARAILIETPKSAQASRQ
jgi:hypothetical protein